MWGMRKEREDTASGSRVKVPETHSSTGCTVIIPGGKSPDLMRACCTMQCNHQLQFSGNKAKQFEEMFYKNMKICNILQQV